MTIILHSLWYSIEKALKKRGLLLELVCINPCEIDCRYLWSLITSIGDSLFWL